MNAQDIISAADLQSEKGIYDALNKSADSDSLLFEVIRQLKVKVGPLRHVLDDALSSVCYFYESSPVRRQLSWPVRVNYDGRLGFRILSGSCLF